MGYVTHEESMKDFGVTVSVTDNSHGEVMEKWSFISIEIDSFESYTPKDLIEIGNFLIEQANKIKKNHHSNGKRKMS